MAGFDYTELPPNLQDGMRRYLENHIKPGAFLVACLTNNFVDALGQVCAPLDIDTYQYIRRVATFLYVELPNPRTDPSPWGSEDAMAKWLARKGGKNRTENERSTTRSLGSDLEGPVDPRSSEG